ncbi:uncharacterized protein LOC109599258 [Aethina tumida]|uniref:uncharacterized protein LOC109599258 n=1 Tax=Aethina tumida TaxID=116153 RepID=UPI00096B4654|nr:uncharacterized protein LOC109599258 [Aethina tumida]
MKTIIFCAILGFAVAGVVRDEPEEITMVKWAIECVRSSLRHGLPAAGIPSHTPVKFSKNITLPFNLIVTSGTLELNNGLVENVPEFNLTYIDYVAANNPNGLYYDYTLHWKQMVIKMQYVLYLESERYDGDITVTFNNLNFSGFWNMTLPSEDRELRLDGFKVDIDVESVDISVTNLFGWFWKMIESLIADAINKSSDTILSTLLQKRFNDAWMSNSTRIETVMNACKN